MGRKQAFGLHRGKKRRQQPRRKVAKETKELEDRLPKSRKSQKTSKARREPPMPKSTEEPIVPTDNEEKEHPLEALVTDMHVSDMLLRALGHTILGIDLDKQGIDVIRGINDNATSLIGYIPRLLEYRLKGNKLLNENWEQLTASDEVDEDMLHERLKIDVILQFFKEDGLEDRIPHLLAFLSVAGVDLG